MSERFLPDKAIDALDEVLVYITNIEVPKKDFFRTSIRRYSRTKNVVVKKKKEEAAKLRDDENASKKI
jgi:ATP-dependent Clp protease ATP-binding subunit ClpA